MADPDHQRSAAGAAVGWARRLSAHPAVAGALAAGTLSPSWARQICDWTDLLPEEHRADADQILLGAAAAGAALADLGALAEEMRRRLAKPDHDDGDGFADRWVRLETTFGGAGKPRRGPGPRLRRGAGRGAGCAGQAGRAGGSAQQGPASARRPRGGVPAADRRRGAARAGRAAHPDPAAFDSGSAPRPARRRRCRGGLAGRRGAAGRGLRRRDRPGRHRPGGPRRAGPPRRRPAARPRPRRPATRRPGRGPAMPGPRMAGRPGPSGPPGN